DHPSRLHDSLVLDLAHQHDERHPAERHEGCVRLRQTEGADVRHHGAPESILHHVEASEIQVEVVCEVGEGADGGAEETDGDPVEERLRPLYLPVAPLAKSLDPFLRLPRDLEHALLVRAGDLDAGEVTPSLDGDLDEDVDGLPQHDATAGDDAVQLRIPSYGERHAARDEVGNRNSQPRFLTQALDIGKRRAHRNLEERIDARVPGRPSCDRFISWSRTPASSGSSGMSRTRVPSTTTRPTSRPANTSRPLYPTACATGVGIRITVAPRRKDFEPAARTSSPSSIGGSRYLAGVTTSSTWEPHPAAGSKSFLSGSVH